MSEPVQIGRREFVARSSIGLGALLVAACQAGFDTSPLSGSVVVSIANHPALDHDALGQHSQHLGRQHGLAGELHRNLATLFRAESLIDLCRPQH